MSDPGSTQSYSATVYGIDRARLDDPQAQHLALAELPLQDILGQTVHMLARLKELRDQIDGTEPGISADLHLLIEDLTDSTTLERLSGLALTLYGGDVTLAEVVNTENQAITHLRSLRDILTDPSKAALMANAVPPVPIGTSFTLGDAESDLDYLDELDRSFDDQEVVDSRYQELAGACAFLPSFLAAAVDEVEARSDRRAHDDAVDVDARLLEKKQQSFAKLNESIADLDHTRQAVEEAWAAIGEAVGFLGAAITGIQTAVRKLPSGDDSGPHALRKKLAVGALNWSQLLVAIRRIGYDRRGEQNPERSPTGLLTRLSYVPGNCGKMLDILEVWTARFAAPEELEPVRVCLEEIVVQALVIVQACRVLVERDSYISSESADLETELEELHDRVRDATTSKPRLLARPWDVTENLPNDETQRYVDMVAEEADEVGSFGISRSMPKELEEWLAAPDYVDFTPRYENLRKLVQAEVDESAGAFLSSLLKDLRDELGKLNEIRAIAREESEALEPETSGTLDRQLSSLVAGIQAYLPAACSKLCDLRDSPERHDRAESLDIAMLRLGQLCQHVLDLVDWSNRNPWGTEYREALTTTEEWVGYVQQSARTARIPVPDKTELKDIWQGNLARLSAAFEHATDTKAAIVPVHLLSRTDCNYVILGNLHSWKWLRACDWQGTLEVKKSHRGWPKVRRKLAKLPIPRKVVTRGSAHLTGGDAAWYDYLAHEIGRRCNILVTHD